MATATPAGPTVAAGTVVLPDGTSIALKNSLKVDRMIEQLYSGGKIAVNSANTHIFCPCKDVVKIVNLETGSVERTLDGDSEPIMCLAVSPDDKILVTTSRSQMLRVWDWTTGECQRQFKAHSAPVVSLAFDSTSTLLATGSSDSTVKVWDIIKGFCTHNFRGSRGVVSLVQFHPKKMQLFSTADDCRIRLWDLNKSQLVADLDGHFSHVSAIAFSADASTMYSAGRDKVIQEWDLNSLKVVHTLPAMEVLEAMVAVPSELLDESVVSADTDYMATVGDQGTLRVWSFPSRKCVVDIKASTAATTQLMNVILCPASGELATVSFEHDVIFRSTFNLNQVTRQFIGSYDEVIDCRFIGANEAHAVVASNSETLKVIELKSLSASRVEGHTDIVLSLDVSADGAYVVSGSKDNTVRVWTVTGKRCVVSPLGLGVGHAEAVGAVAMSRRGAAFVVSGSKDTTIKRWNLKDVIDNGASADGPAALAASYTRPAHAKDINSIAVSPNDKLLVTASQDRTAKVWHAQDGKLMGTLKGHKRGVWCAVFSPVDQVVATASADTTVRVWSLADYSCVKTFEGHVSSVLRVCFVTRGMQLLTSGSDGLLKLWTIKNNELVDTFDSHEDKAWALAVSRDGMRALSGGSDSRVVLWEDNTSEVEGEKAAAQELMIEQTQQLNNLMHAEKYQEAIKLALSLDHPRTLLSISNKLIGLGRKAGLSAVVKTLSDQEAAQLLSYCSTWNSNSRTSGTAQVLLGVVLRAFAPTKLKSLPGIKKTVESLLPYSERHLQRLDRMLQLSAFADYSWRAANLAAATSSVSLPAYVPVAAAAQPTKRAAALVELEPQFELPSPGHQGEAAGEEPEEELEEGDGLDEATLVGEEQSTGNVRQGTEVGAEPTFAEELQQDRETPATPKRARRPGKGRSAADAETHEDGSEEPRASTPGKRARRAKAPSATAQEGSAKKTKKPKKSPKATQPERQAKETPRSRQKRPASAAPPATTPEEKPARKAKTPRKARSQSVETEEGGKRPTSTRKARKPVAGEDVAGSPVVAATPKRRAARTPKTKGKAASPKVGDDSPIPMRVTRSRAKK